LPTKSWLARFFRIDEAHGGLTSTEPLIAMDTLDQEIRREAERQKQAEAPQNEEAH
jgi:hypothetical protein